MERYMRNSILLVVILFLGTLNLNAQTAGEMPMQDKDPALAMVYSLLLPGLGQIYNEDLDNGFTLFGFSTVGGVMLLAGGDGVEVAGGLVFVVCRLISIIEAPIRSASINKENRIKRAALIKNYGLKDLGFNRGITIGYSFSL